MKFIDYRNCGFGLLVKRSAHQREQLCIRTDAPDTLGIITDKEFYEEGGRVVCYPVVYWEGASHSSMCHPANVEPYRPHNLPVIDDASTPLPQPDDGKPDLAAENMDVQFYLDAAQAHGEDSDPDHEVGDLQDLLRAAWDLMSPDQRRQFATTDAATAVTLEEPDGPSGSAPKVSF